MGSAEGFVFVVLQCGAHEPSTYAYVVYVKNDGSTAISIMYCIERKLSCNAERQMDGTHNGFYEKYIHYFKLHYKY